MPARTRTPVDQLDFGSLSAEGDIVTPDEQKLEEFSLIVWWGVAKANFDRAYKAAHPIKAKYADTGNPTPYSKAVSAVGDYFKGSMAEIKKLEETTEAQLTGQLRDAFLKVVITKSDSNLSLVDRQVSTLVAMEQEKNRYEQLQSILGNYRQQKTHPLAKLILDAENDSDAKFSFEQNILAPLKAAVMDRLEKLQQKSAFERGYPGIITPSIERLLSFDALADTVSQVHQLSGKLDAADEQLKFKQVFAKLPGFQHVLDGKCTFSAWQEQFKTLLAAEQKKVNHFNSHARPYCSKFIIIDPAQFDEAAAKYKALKLKELDDAIKAKTHAIEAANAYLKEFVAVDQALATGDGSSLDDNQRRFVIGLVANQAKDAVATLWSELSPLFDRYADFDQDWQKRTAVEQLGDLTGKLAQVSGNLILLTIPTAAKAEDDKTLQQTVADALTDKAKKTKETFDKTVAAATAKKQGELKDRMMKKPADAALINNFFEVINCPADEEQKQYLLEKLTVEGDDLERPCWQVFSSDLTPAGKREAIKKVMVDTIVEHGYAFDSVKWQLNPKDLQATPVAEADRNGAYQKLHEQLTRSTGYTSSTKGATLFARNAGGQAGDEKYTLTQCLDKLKDFKLNGEALKETETAYVLRKLMYNGDDKDKIAKRDLIYKHLENFKAAANAVQSADGSSAALDNEKLFFDAIRTNTGHFSGTTGEGIFRDKIASYDLRRLTRA